MKRSLLIIVCVLLISLVGIYFFNKDHTSNEAIPTVSVVKVIRENLAEEITLSAELVPYQKAILYAKVSGYLKKINVDIGDHVKSGDVLAQLEVPELKDELSNQKAKNDIAKLEYDRLKTASEHHPGLIAQEDIDKAKADFEMAQANYEHANTLVKFATITAPYDGVITKRFVDEGALIQVGTSSSTQAQPVVEVVENTKLRLVFPIPEANVTEIKVGDPAEITIQSTGHQFSGNIARMANQIDFNTRTMRTEIDVDNSSFKMKSGMYAAVRLFLKRKNNCLAIPTQAVDMQGNPNVWIVTKDGIVEKRLVKIEIITPNLIGIADGLNEGDLVVFGNRDLLKQGSPVIPKILNVSDLKTNG